MSDLTHIRENSSDTEQHLSENREKFETDCVYLLRLMMMGKRLSRQMVSAMKINERRLGDLWEDGKCQREWVMRTNEEGNLVRSHVEYFCNVSKPPTKESVIEKHKSASEHLRVVEKNLVTVFTLPPDTPNDKLVQKPLFQL